MSDRKKTTIADCFTTVSIFPHRDGTVSLKINNENYENISIETVFDMIGSDVTVNREILYGS